MSGRKIVMPSRHRIKSKLNSEFNQVKAVLIERLSKQNVVCITTDVWSSHAQSYLGATIHFINDSFERESYLIAFKRLYGRQTYDVLAKEINNIMENYGIKCSQVSNIVTDGGSNFCKMFKEFGQHLDASTVVTEDANISVESISDSVTDSEHAVDNLDSYEDAMTWIMQDDDGNEFTNEILNFDEVSGNTISATDQNQDDDYRNYFGEPSSRSQPEPNRIRLPPQRRCQSHILNLLSSDF